MADSVGPSAQNQILQTLNRVDRKETSAQAALSPVSSDDTVSISQEAQDLSQAQSAAIQISSDLGADATLGLSGDASRLADLA